MTTNLSCPKCDGISGYGFTMVERHYMYGFWGEAPSSEDSKLLSINKTVCCADCNKRIPMNEIEETINAEYKGSR